jgi:hypothetical protein
MHQAAAIVRRSIPAFNGSRPASEEAFNAHEASEEAFNAHEASEEAFNAQEG